jgi:hypothetical protein
MHAARCTHNRKKKKKKKKKIPFRLHSSAPLSQFTPYSVFSQSAPSSSSVDFHFSTLSRLTLSLSALYSPLAADIIVALPLSLLRR